MLQRLVQILKKHVEKPTHFLDFYSGVGTFSIFFAKQVKELHLVEWNKYSIQLAEINLANSAHNAKCFFHCLNSEKWKDTQEAKLLYDVAIVDPPRSGIDKMSLSWFAKRKVKTLLYVSCNPATFVRDSSFLIMQGYTLQNCYFLDFYPQTHHLEVLGIFSL